jgi:hypothetical protein
MTRAKNIIIPSLVVLILGLFVIYAYRSGEDNLRTLDFGPLKNRIAARVAPMIVVSISGGSRAPTDERYLYSYSNAANLSKHFTEFEMKQGVPLSAANLEKIDSRIRLDGWGHPFCLVETKDRLAIFSGGRAGFGPGACEEVKPLESDISRLKTGVLNLYPSGVSVLVIANPTQD